LLVLSPAGQLLPKDRASTILPSAFLRNKSSPLLPRAPEYIKSATTPSRLSSLVRSSMKKSPLVSDPDRITSGLPSVAVSDHPSRETASGPVFWISIHSAFEETVVPIQAISETTTSAEAGIASTEAIRNKKSCRNLFVISQNMS